VPGFFIVEYSDKIFAFALNDCPSGKCTKKTAKRKKTAFLGAALTPPI
jgi:hypothetical protein